MKRIILRLGLATVACAAAFCAEKVWDTKPYTDWTQEDLHRILNDSPWAKKVNVVYDASGMQRRGGMGGGGRGGGGIGFPGGGGMGRGRGGGMGRGGPGGASRSSMSVVVRWDSAHPIQQALARIRPQDQGDGKAPEALDKHYVVTVVGLQMPAGRGGRGPDADDTGSDNRGANNRNADQMRDQLMTYTQLVANKKTTLSPYDVKINRQSGESEIQFFFSKDEPLSRDDQEVTFTTKVGPMKVQKKFNLKEMTFRGKTDL